MQAPSLEKTIRCKSISVACDEGVNRGTTYSVRACANIFSTTAGDEGTSRTAVGVSLFVDSRLESCVACVMLPSVASIASPDSCTVPAIITAAFGDWSMDNVELLATPRRLIEPENWLAFILGAEVGV